MYICKYKYQHIYLDFFFLESAWGGGPQGPQGPQVRAPDTRGPGHLWGPWGPCVLGGPEGPGPLWGP